MRCQGWGGRHEPIVEESNLGQNTWVNLNRCGYGLRTIRVHLSRTRGLVSIESCSDSPICEITQAWMCICANVTNPVAVLLSA
jgi:hypothetical protein